MNQDVFGNKSHPGESAPTVVNQRKAQVMPEKQLGTDVSDYQVSELGKR